MQPRSQTDDCGEPLSVQDSRIESTDEASVADPADDEEIGVAIVEAVSSVSGVEPCEMDTRLYDVIDPDALSRTIRSGGPDIQVSFRFGAYHVSVFSGGEIEVSEADFEVSGADSELSETDFEVS